MRQTIYLIATPGGIDRMTKRQPDHNRGELPIKVTVNLPSSLFAPPTISQEITIADPFRDVEIGRDVELRQLFITQDEADVIKRRRMQEMREVLEAAGYKVEAPEDQGEAGTE
jgi:hypothetical protein